MFFSKTYSQKKIEGKYYKESGSYIEINNDYFKIILPNSASNGIYSEIRTEGRIQQIDNNFLELNSLKDPFIEATRNLEIIRKPDRELSNDSLKIKFFLPYTNGILRITIYTEISKTFSFNYSKDNKECTIPFIGGNISFLIRPDYILPHTAEGLFYGILEYNTLDFFLEKDINNIEVNIPTIDNSFFEKYYIKGDYARIVNDSIIWKGEIYRKSDK